MFNRSSFAQEPYDEQKVEAIRVRLENYAAVGKPLDYQVFVNGEEIVPRTNDATRFDSIFNLLNENTKSLTIHEFQGESRHKKTSHFLISQPAQSTATPVNGFDVSSEVEKRFNEFRLDFINKELEKDVKVLKDEVIKLEAENKKLGDELSDTKEDLKKLIGEQSLGHQIIGTLKELMPERHHKHSSPLSGTEQQNEKKKEHVEETVVLTKGEYENYKLFDQFMSPFNNAQQGQVMHLIEFLGKKTELIEETLQFIYSKNPE
jgi:hypothetical protein